MTVDDFWLQAAWEDLNGTTESIPVDEEEWYPEYDEEKEEEYYR